MRWTVTKTLVFDVDGPTAEDEAIAVVEAQPDLPPIYRSIAAEPMEPRHPAPHGGRP